jgi:prephenate dehydratase
MLRTKNGKSGSETGRFAKSSFGQNRLGHVLWPQWLKQAGKAGFAPFGNATLDDRSNLYSGADCHKPMALMPSAQEQGNFGMSDIENVKISFQGARGAFSHRAGQIFAEQLGAKAAKSEFAPLQGFNEVFDSIVSGECAFGVIPLENSSVGSIVANYDLLWNKDVLIEAEIMLPVQHQLLGFPEAKIEELEIIYSHPVALDQCRVLLKSLPNVKAISYWDTSGAAFFVKESANPRMAAIASEFAAKETGLTILKANVEDHAGNNTRFGIIRKDSYVHGSKNNGKTESGKAETSSEPYKLSCAAEIAHKPGSLAKLLTALADIGANLTKIESRPIPETPWHYRFFLDMELKSGSHDDKIMAALSEYCRAYKILGRYKNWSIAPVAK